MANARSVAVKVSSPLGDDTLLFRRMNATEELGRLFRFDLEVYSTDLNIEPEDLLGQSLTVSLELADGSLRHFNGLASRFSFVGTEREYAIYQITLRPWLWFLTRTADCRIFQDKTVPDIIKDIFREHGFSDFNETLGSGDYRTWGYCVQYRETDFNFVSRLMEQEGIYYFFRHEDGRHSLELADGIGAHDTFPGYDEIHYYPPDESSFREDDHVRHWSLSKGVQPGIYSIRDYSFETPKTQLQSVLSSPRSHDKADFEIYDYPGEYRNSGEGDVAVKNRLTELQCQYARAAGRGNARGIAVGSLFTLAGFPREDQNREYLVLSTRMDIQGEPLETSPGAGVGATFDCAFEAMDQQQTFRSERSTPKPVVQGPQTAVVVGKDGEEIWTDKYGRIKVQFHWDREGESNEQSSCWVRVGQMWAGSGWGALHIPRMGHEVIVEFLEGDPDRPIVTGSVYNDSNMPPYDLPANQTQSGVKSRSTKEGSAENFNEIRFEDKKGEEYVYIHAEKDEGIIVENDKSEEVGNDVAIKIGNDRTMSVGHNETVTVKNDRSETVSNNETLTVENDRKRDVGNNEEVTVGQDRSVTIGNNSTCDIASEASLTVGSNRTTDVGEDDSLTVGKNLVIEAGDQIVLRTGRASITLQSDGTIQVEGADISFKASGKFNVKASSDVIIKGSKVTSN